MKKSKKEDTVEQIPQVVFQAAAREAELNIGTPSGIWVYTGNTAIGTLNESLETVAFGSEETHRDYEKKLRAVVEEILKRPDSQKPDLLNRLLKVTDLKITVRGARWRVAFKKKGRTYFRGQWE